jgi:hypothetical protein
LRLRHTTSHQPTDPRTKRSQDVSSTATHRDSRRRL